MKRKIKLAIILGTLLFSGQILFAQYATTRVNDKFQAYTDSLKQVEYDYIFPFLGQGAYKKGFDIPYPAGVMSNFIWMRQSIIMSNMQLGFDGVNNNIPLTNVDDLIEFGQNTNTSYTVNFRPDLWVFPFLNVYGLFGYGHSTTEVNLVAPVALNSVVEQNISTKGFGVLGGGGVGPVWVTVDANWTWNKPELLEDPVKVRVMGIRVGHTIKFNHRPQSNVAFWIGAMSANMSSGTVGAVALKDALPADFWTKKDQFVDDYWAWYNSLDPSKPGDRIKIDKADKILTPIVESIDSRSGEGVVKYAMDKQVKEKWNGLFGAQYQLNKHWMFRTEAGLIGDRKQILASVNYRFLL